MKYLLLLGALLGPVSQANNCKSFNPTNLDDPCRPAWIDGRYHKDTNADRYIASQCAEFKAGRMSRDDLVEFQDWLDEDTLRGSGHDIQVQEVCDL